MTTSWPHHDRIKDVIEWLYSLYNQIMTNYLIVVLKVKNVNPSWGDSKIAKEAALTSSRSHGGKTMSLSSKGIAKLTSNILSRFNSKTIDNIAGG